MQRYLPSKKIILPLIITVLLPALNILNNNIYKTQINLGRIFNVWMILSFYLLLIWMANSVLIQQQYFKKNAVPAFKILATLLLNFSSISGIIFFNTLVLQKNLGLEDIPIWFIFLRLSIASLIIISIQLAQISIREAQQFRIENFELQRENAEARFAVLKQQINPHFLFNALSTLRNMVRTNDPNTERFILKLSDLYRQLLKKSDHTTVSVAEELDFLNKYIFMLKARFERMMMISIEIRPESDTLKIPAFGLQLLVENCIKHNAISSLRPLHITIFQETADSVTVTNNLQLRTSKEESYASGLKNLIHRYALLHIPDGVTIQQTATSFSVTLKLIG
jgi:sensor histidine kinase YesM